MLAATIMALLAALICLGAAIIWRTAANDADKCIEQLREHNALLRSRLAVGDLDDHATRPRVLTLPPGEWWVTPSMDDLAAWSQRPLYDWRAGS